MASSEVIVTGNETAMTLALQTVEKKVRNLEKRKVSVQLCNHNKEKRC